MQYFSASQQSLWDREQWPIVSEKRLREVEGLAQGHITEGSCRLAGWLLGLASVCSSQLAFLSSLCKMNYSLATLAGYPSDPFLTVIQFVWSLCCPHQTEGSLKTLSGPQHPTQD